MNKTHEWIEPLLACIFICGTGAIPRRERRGYAPSIGDATHRS